MNSAIEGLIHHVELNQSGWRQKTIGLLMLELLFDSTQPLSPVLIVEMVREKHRISLDIPSVEKCLSGSIKEGIVCRQSDGTYRLSENGRLRVVEHSEEAEALEERVSARFQKIVEMTCPDAGLTWAMIKTGFLEPIAASLGARVFELIQENGLSQEVVNRASGLDLDWTKAKKAAVALAMEQFVDPEDSDIRAYLLRLLNTDLLVRASSITEENLRALNFSPSNRLSMKVFVDTNFLFSIMGLHENPADDSAEALVRLVGEMRDRLDVKFVALPSTVDEARRTLAGYADRLARVSTAPNVLSAIEKGGSELSGITLKYLRQAGRQASKFTAKEYFNPYLQDFLAAMRSFGVELFNADTDKWRTDQDVIDDILAQQEWERENRPLNRAKSYEALEHDLILWHLVKRERPSRVESPIRAQAWIGTIDFGFIRFDEYKRRIGHSKIPLCIHPATMLQMLQFWMPRTPDLEKALVQSLWPLLPHIFDAKAEEVTIRILAAISRYENVEDLPDETVTSLLINESLRSRINNSKSSEEDSTFVDGEILTENDRLRRKWESEKARAVALDKEVRAKNEQVEDSTREANQRIDKIGGELDGVKKMLTETQSREILLQKEVDRQKRLEKYRSARAMVFLKVSVLSFVELVLFALGKWVFDWVQIGLPVSGWLVFGFVAFLILWIPLETGVYWASKHEGLKDSKGNVGVKKLRSVFRWILGVAVAAAIVKIVEIGISGTV